GAEEGIAATAPAGKCEDQIGQSGRPRSANHRRRDDRSDRPERARGDQSAGGEMRRGLTLIVMICMLGCRAPQSKLATPAEAIASKTDLWGEAALKQPGGPSYEFFEKLLPPLRYVDADFRHYPINLSAPAATVKGRLVSNGSAINARARQPNWNNESGTPVRILVGPRRRLFGENLARLDGPHYL